MSSKFPPSLQPTGVNSPDQNSPLMRAEEPMEDSDSTHSNSSSIIAPTYSPISLHDQSDDTSVPISSDESKLSRNLIQISNHHINSRSCTNTCLLKSSSGRKISHHEKLWRDPLILWVLTNFDMNFCGRNIYTYINLWHIEWIWKEPNSNHRNLKP